MSTILYLTTIEFGPGSRKELPRALNELAIRRPLVVSDSGVAAEGVLDQAIGAMDAPRFLDVPANPTEAAVQSALDAYRAGGCDGIVAVGGGSPIDLAKGVALLATHPGPLEDLRGDLRRCRRGSGHRLRRSSPCRPPPAPAPRSAAPRCSRSTTAASSASSARISSRSARSATRS